MDMGSATTATPVSTCHQPGWFRSPDVLVTWRLFACGRGTRSRGGKLWPAHHIQSPILVNKV